MVTTVSETLLGGSRTTPRALGEAIRAIAEGPDEALDDLSAPAVGVFTLRQLSHVRRPTHALW